MRMMPIVHASRYSFSIQSDEGKLTRARREIEGSLGAKAVAFKKWLAIGNHDFKERSRGWDIKSLMSYCRVVVLSF